MLCVAKVILASKVPAPCANPAALYSISQVVVPVFLSVQEISSVAGVILFTPYPQVGKQLRGTSNKSKSNPEASHLSSKAI